MRKLTFYLLFLALGTALAQGNSTPPPGQNTGSAIQAVYDALFGSQAVLDMWDVWKNPIGAVAPAVSTLALALFVVALLYRVYNLWLSEAPSQAIFYSLVRWFIIGAFLLTSNYYLYYFGSGRHSGYYLLGPGGNVETRCRQSDIVLSKVVVCTWVNSLKAGAGEARRLGVLPRLEQSVLNLTAQILETYALLKLLKVLRIGQKYGEHQKKPGGPVPPPKEQTGQAPDGGASLLNQLVKGLGLVPLVLYLVLAVPSTIYFFLVLVSGLMAVLVAVLLPLAIALLAFGLRNPVINLSFTGLAVAFMAYFMPIIMALSLLTAVDRPAQILNSMWQASMQSVKQAVNTIVQKILEEEHQMDQNMNQTDTNAPWYDFQQWFNKLKEWSTGFFKNLARLILSAVLTLLMILVLLTVGTVFMIILVAVSFSAALSLLTVVPNVILGMIGSERIGSPNLAGPPAPRDNPVYQIFRR